MADFTPEQNILGTGHPVDKALETYLFTTSYEQDIEDYLLMLETPYPFGLKMDTNDYVGEPEDNPKFTEYMDLYQEGKKAIDIAREALIKSLKPNELYVLSYTDKNGNTKYFTLTKENIPKFTRLMDTKIDTKVNSGSNMFSDGVDVDYYSYSNLTGLYAIPRSNSKGEKNISKIGKVFPYLNTSSYDLTEYQIISDPKDITLCSEHCLLFSLNKAGIKKTEINKIRPNITSANYPASKLAVIADILKVTIVLRYHRNTNKRHDGVKDGNRALSIRITRYGSYEREVEIALYNEHYFVYNQVDYSYFNEKKIQIIHKKIPSLTLIHKLHTEGKFVPDKCFNSLPTVFNKSDNSDLCRTHQAEHKTKEDNNYKKPNIAVVFADTESTTNNKMVCKNKLTDKAHIAFRHGFIFLDKYGNDDEVIITRTYDEHFTQIVKRSREIGAQKTIVYYHNLKYDFCLMKQYSDLHIVSMTVKDGQYYSVSVMYDKHLIELRDSYKLISYKLSAFASNFDLKSFKQEMIIYSLYHADNINNASVTVEDFADVVPLALGNTLKVLKYYNLKGRSYVKTTCEEVMNSPKDYVIFDRRIVIHRNCIDEFNQLIDDDNGGKVKLVEPPRSGYRGFKIKGHYLHNVHCDYYLKYDCIVLRDGLVAFNTFMQKTLGLDIYDNLTISSLAHNYAISKGCYDGIYGINNTTRNFVTQCMSGGRVSTRFNNRYIAEGRIEDYDGVSLYPSAIRRFCSEIGFPKGAFAVIKDEAHFRRLKDRATTVYYFVEIIALHNTKKQQIAFPRIKTNEGKIVYTNKVKGKHLFLGKIAFEDLVEFSGLVNYQFVKGIYWRNISDHVNRGLGEVVQELFDLRLQMKREKNKIGDTCMKLALNSLYGKNMQGRAKEKIVCKKRYADPKDLAKCKDAPKECREFMRYLIKNSSNIKSFSFLGKTVIFKEEFDSLYECNNIHIACMILDMSRRIMNEVMSVAENCKVPILYTDTDSMHIVNTNDELSRLEAAYLKKYNRVLAGESLGQFHKDFVFANHIDVYAIKSYIIDKKVYCDVLRGIRLQTEKNKYGQDIPARNEDGKIIIVKNSEGEPQIDYTIHYRFKGINDYAMKEQAAIYGSIEEVYKELIKGTVISFDLCYGDAPSFDLTGMPFSREMFLRRVEFKDKDICFFPRELKATYK